MDKDTVKEGVQVYELGYLVLPSIAEDKLSGVVEKIKSAVSKAGGQEIDGEEPFKHPLSYTMSKTVGASRYVVNEAYIGWIKFELAPMSALEVKTAVDSIDEVLRTLLIKAPRETSFSFAKAKELIAEKARLEAEAAAALAEEAAPAEEESVVE